MSATFPTIVDTLAWRAYHQPDKLAFTYLKDGEKAEANLTYKELDRRARSIALQLQQRCTSGDRALLLYPPGLDFIAAFFGCLYAGAVAVPAYPPPQNRSLSRLLGIVDNSQPRLILTTREVAEHMSWHAWAEELAIQVVCTDLLNTDLKSETWIAPEQSPEKLAFLQYTSGSTGNPKGVMVTHGNIMHNQRIIQEAFEHTEQSIAVSWLPLYHDMGLIGSVIQPLYVGFPCIFMSPLHFFQQPLRWMQAISNYHATTSGGPNYAYELCIRKIADENKKMLDLSSWRIACVGAEPVRADTLQGFTEAFAPCGFRREAFQPCYGLAEATVMVTGGYAGIGPAIHCFRSDELRPEGWADPLDEPAAKESAYLVGCGIPLDQRLAIVTADGREILDGKVGEIWVAGPSIARGYWDDPKGTENTFNARLSGTEDEPFLRTGDLGCLRDGVLFVTGRIKDLLIIRGRNYYPQDIELTVGQSHKALSPDRCAAFSMEVEGTEQLVVVQEVQRQFRKNQVVLKEAATAIRAALLETHELAPHAVVLIAPHSLPLTSSGKIQRKQSKQNFLNNKLTVCWQWRSDDQTAARPSYVAARTPAEELLCMLWCEVLGIEQVGIHEDFFALGGQSLLATQLVSRVRETFRVEVSLRSLFETPTVAGLAESIEASGPQAVNLAGPPLRPVARESEGLPLTFAQEGLWFLEQLAPGSPFNKIAVARHLSGPLNVDALKQSFTEILRRHEALRATFADLDGKIVQFISPPRDLELPLVDLSGFPPHERQLHLRQLIDEERRRPFELSQGPLLRATLLRLGQQEHVLIVVIHHIASDAWSLAVLSQELRALYAAFCVGSPSPLPELPIQYADFAFWQRQWLLDEALDEELDYWRKQLGDTLPKLELPTDRPRSSLPSFRGGSQELRVDVSLTESLQNLSRKARASLFMALLAAFQLLLNRYTGQEDILVGISSANRERAQTKNLIGCFVNLLAFRTDLSGNPSFMELLNRVKEVALGAYAHQNLAVEKLAETLHQGNMIGTPIFDVVFDFLNLPQPALELSELSISDFDLSEEESKFPLTVTIEEQRGELRIRVAYQSALFTAERIACILDQFQFLLQQIVAEPEKATQSYSLVTAKSRTLLPDPRTLLPEPKVPLITELFETWAERTPEKVAICQGERTWTYSQLAKSARGLARSLLKQGLRRGEAVGVLGSPSYGTIASMMAVLLSGGVLLSLDRKLPANRQKIMLAEAGASRLIRINNLQTGDEWIYGIPTLTITCVDQDNGSPSLQEQASNAEAVEMPILSPDDAAYIIFTTGTTSVPKGVLGCHKGLSHFLNWQRETFAVGPHDRFVQLTNFSFDMALRDVFLPLSSGSTLYLLQEAEDLASDRVLPLMEREKITLLHIVPTLAQSWLATMPEGITLRSLRYTFFAGEPLTDTLVRQWREAFPQSGEAVNLYGPTETTQSKCFYLVPSHPSPGVQPVGCPLPETQALVLAPNNRLCGIGEPGEIVIRTPFRTLGYVNNQEENKKRFVKNPFRDDDMDLLYYSKDRGCYRVDGSLSILGRLDHQVKIRGVTVEPGEVTAFLSQHPAVKSCIVIPHTDAQGQNSLVAFLVVSNPEEVSIPELRSFLGKQLIEAMIPSAYVFLDHLPTAPNGKIDRKALPIPNFAKLGTAGNFTAPRTAVEELLAVIWSQTLHTEQVGIYDNFFELGGHSLSAIQLISRIRENLHVELPLRSLFETPTIAGLATAIVQYKDKQTSSATLPTIASDLDRQHEPFPLTDIQQAYWVGRSGALELGGVSAHSYREFEAEDLDVERFGQAWQRLIERHAMLRAIILPNGQQQILEQVPPYQVELADLRDLAPSDAQRRLEAIRQQMSHQVLPSDRWPLFQVRLSQLSNTRVRIHISIDALICDAWSRQLLVWELAQFYRDPQLSLAPLTLTFRDYVLAEQALQDSELYRRSQDYWRGRLTTLPPAPALPLAKNPSTLSQPRFTRRSAAIAAPLWQQLKTRASRAGLTPSGLLAAAFAEVLSVWSKTPRFTINLTLFNRLPLHPQVNELVGDFTSLTLLEVDNSSPRPFEERARRLQEQLWNDIEHSYFSGVRVLRELIRKRGMGPRAILPVVFTSALTGPDMGFMGATPLHWFGEMVYAISQTPQVWLDHQTYEEAGALMISWDAVEDLFPQGMLDEMFAAYSLLLEQLATQEQCWQASLPQLTPLAQLQQRAAINATQAPISPELLHTLFASQVVLRPEQPAVIDAQRQLTYSELDQLARQTAHRLRQLGARPNTLVAVVLEKGWQQVVAVLAILQAGAAYLPIDPTLPKERFCHLLEHGQVTLALTHTALHQELSWPAGVQRLCLDQQGHAQATLPPLEPWQQPQDLAYVIYTSGSTGLPKGVMIDHRGAVNTILDINRRFQVGPTDRVLALSSLSFDLSVYDIFGMLAAGGTIVMPQATGWRDPAHWAELLSQQQVTIWNSVPALMQMLLASGSQQRQVLPASLRLVLLSGDWIPLSLPQQLQALKADLQVISLGGATETSIWSILYPIEQVDPTWTSIPYGRPMANQTFAVLNELLEPCPVWVAGHLYIGGIGLAQGYWRDAERTQASFVRHPRTGERLYATGDLGRYLPDGTIEFLGREDFQVKIHGYRIELGEIEAALAECQLISAAAVSTLGEKRGEQSLVAFIVPKQTQKAKTDVLENLSAELPSQATISQESLSNASLEKLEFKLSQPGLRSGDEGKPYFQLAEYEIAEKAYTGRRSHRRFMRQPISFDQFSQFLGCLRQIEFAGLPKYRYASAGGLYPVQTYLYLKHKRVEGLEAGIYYYHPREHRLVLVQDSSQIEQSLLVLARQAEADEPAFAILLIGKLSAIAPVYGKWARDFCMIEAGLMSQLLETVAPDHQIGLCQIGGLANEQLQHLFALADDSIYLHCLVGGRIDTENIHSPLAPTASASDPDATPGRGGSDIIEEIRDFLNGKLPGHMIPSAFMLLDRLPLTPNGKVDRQALSELGKTRLTSRETTFTPPLTPLERRLERLWAETLGQQRVSIHDNFFELGGDSLQAVQLTSKISAALHSEISIRLIFTYPTIAALADALAASLLSDESASNTSPMSAITTGTTPSHDLSSKQPSPFIKVERRPLLSLFACGKTAPVEAAALSYLPASLLRENDLSRDAVIHEIFDDLPLLTDIRDTPLGRVASIILPRFSSELYSDEKGLTEDLVEALGVAKRLGAGIVSLTGLIPSATDYGRALQIAIASRNDLPAITTGHATTAAAVVLAIRRLLHEGGRDLSQERVGFLGLGSIGLASLRLMLKCLPHPTEIILCDVYRKLDLLEAVQRELVNDLEYRGAVSIVGSQAMVPPEFYDATLIVGATNAHGVLDIANVKPGTLIVDDSYPHCFTSESAIRRFQTHGDILFTEGGVLHSPQPMSTLRYLPHVAEQALSMERLEAVSTSNPFEITGCVFSSLLSSRFEDLKPTVGLADVQCCYQHYTMLDRLEFQAADLHCDGFRPPKESIRNFRSRFGNLQE